MTVTSGGPDGSISWLGGVVVNGPAPVDFDQGDDDRLDVDVDFAFNLGIPYNTRYTVKFEGKTYAIFNQLDRFAVDWFHIHLL